MFRSTYGIEAVGLRYFNIFGPRQSPTGAYAAVIPLFMQALQNNEAPVINGYGNQSRDFTFVENAVQANVKGIFSSKPDVSSQVMNIGCGERISINDLWQTLSTAAGKDIAPTYGFVEGWRCS